MRLKYSLGVIVLLGVGAYAYFAFLPRDGGQNSQSPATAGVSADSEAISPHSAAKPRAATALSTQPAPNAPAVPSAPTAPTTASTASIPTQAPVPAQPVAQNECVTQTFTHETADGHEDGEACLYHKNLVRLQTTLPVNSKSVCVRVNNKPTKFKFIATKEAGKESGGGQVLLAAVAGPTSKITVSYCTGTMTCLSDCTIPKDDFMEAIGGTETDEDLFSDRAAKVGWKKGKNPEKEEESLRRELAELKKTLKDELKKGSLFEGWQSTAQTQTSCGVTKASK